MGKLEEELLEAYGDKLPEAKDLVKQIANHKSNHEPYITNILLQLLWLQQQNDKQAENDAK